MDLTTSLTSCGRFGQFLSISTGGGGLEMCMFKGGSFFVILDSFESRALEATDIFFPKVLLASTTPLLFGTAYTQTLKFGVNF